MIYMAEGPESAAALTDATKREHTTGTNGRLSQGIKTVSANQYTQKSPTNW